MFKLDKKDNILYAEPWVSVKVFSKEKRPNI